MKLCSVGYADFDLMAQKFYVLYATCKEQLSAQKHYDWVRACVYVGGMGVVWFTGRTLFVGRTM